MHPSDRFVCCLQTCRRFLEASNHFQFANDFTLNLSKSVLSDNEPPAKDFLGSFRSFPNMIFQEVEFSESKEFWNHIGPDVECLSIILCDITERKLKEILETTRNLKHLKIQNCRELFMSGRFFDNDHLSMDNLTSLSLAQNRYLSDSIFSRITRIMPNLSSLDLSKNFISFHNGLYRKFYPKHHNEETGSESVFTFHFIRKFIRDRAEKIKHLDFSSTLIDGNTLQLLADIENLHLTTLHLQLCDQLTNNGIISLISVQPNLQELDLSYSVRITDTGMMAITEHLKKLKILKVRRCRALTDISVKMIADMPCLEVLDISECEAITSAAIVDGGIASKKNTMLQELYLSALNICEMAVSSVAENLPNLRVLDLSFCFNHIDDICIQKILQKLVWLRTLNLDHCERVSDAGLTGMSMADKTDNNTPDNQKAEDDKKNDPVSLGYISCHPGTSMNHPGTSMNQPLVKISLRTKAETEIINDALRKRAMLQMAKEINIHEHESSNISIAHLRGLRVLKLGRCNKVTDVSLIYNFKLPELREINLSKCQQISIIGIQALVENCPSLEIVDLSECHNINDKCIELVTSKLHRLTSLNIQKCQQLTDFSLDYIAMNCKRIRSINIMGCRHMSDEPHLRLASVKSLKTFVFSMPGHYADTSRAAPSAPVLPALRY